MWDPAKLAIAERAMDDPDALLFFHNAWLIDGTGKRTGPANIFSLPESNPPLSVYSFFSPLILDGVPSLTVGVVGPVGPIDRQQRQAGPRAA